MEVREAMTTLRPGARCLVDVVAMGRDGPTQRECGCDSRPAFRRSLRSLAEQVVTVSHWQSSFSTCLTCRRNLPIFPGTISIDATSWASGPGYQINPKYLIPLPEQTP